MGLIMFSFTITPSMEDLPTNVSVDILSRLPVKTVIYCKCVCKKWRNQILESYSVNLHLSRSPAGVMIHHFTRDEMYNNGLGILKWVEIEDKKAHYHLSHDPVMSFDLNLAPIPQGVRKIPEGSVNGLICLRESGNGSDNTYLCNPITRIYDAP